MAPRTVYKLRSLSSTRPGSNQTASLPPEILSQCFVYLPFFDRFYAARVSKYWRSSALSYKGLWADIRLSADIQVSEHMALLHLALERSGLHPIDLECTTCFYLPDRIVQMLIKHMHHIRSIIWYGSRDSAGFTTPAPILERYVYKSMMPTFYHFLGGTPGVLRYVESALFAVPASCPPFSTVTHLVLRIPKDQSSRALNDMLALFPRLVSLSLKGLLVDYALLPGMGTAPPTLRHLSIDTDRQDCNLAKYISKWCPHGTKDIQLSMPVQASSHLAFLLRDAVEIFVEAGRFKGWPYVEELYFASIKLPAQRLLKVRFTDYPTLRESSDIIIRGLLSSASGFAQLRRLTLPLYTLHMFLRRRPALPLLSRVEIIIQDASREQTVIDFTRLYCLALLKSCALSSISFDIRTLLPNTATAADAASLVSYIKRFGPGGVRYVLRGFPADATSAIATGCTEGWIIELDGPQVHQQPGVNAALTL